MPEPQIIDTTVIQVKSTTKDGYGNLIVTPIEGDDIKVSEKRSHLFDIFQQGATVKLLWAEYMHKKYVARAELGEASQASAEELVAPLKKEPRPMLSTDDTKIRSMAIAYAKDLVVAKIIELKDMAVYANRFIDYILNVKKEVQPAKSKLVEEAKKIGGKEG